MTVRVPADLAREPAARTARKAPVPVEVEFAAAAGTLATAEGPVAYEPGDALLTGPAGERWPVPRARFLHDYEMVDGGRAGTPGRYRKRPGAVRALRMNAPFTVTLPNGRGTLSGAAGDWLVQYGPGDQAVVAASIFAATYELVD
jgi:hypothetical protein